MNQTIILDDVFDETIRIPLLNQFEYAPIKWFEMGENPYLEQILNVCGIYFDLSTIIGYEMWSNAIGLNWHYDKDEKIFEKENRLVFPLCSIVYYLEIDNLLGGHLMIQGENNSIGTEIMPRSNRLVLFTSGMLHSVAPYTGTRKSISISPWDVRPL